MSLHGYSSSFLRDAAKSAAKQEIKERKARTQQLAHKKKQEAKWEKERLDREAHINALFARMGIKANFSEKDDCIVINDSIAISAAGGDGTTFLQVLEIVNVK